MAASSSDRLRSGIALKANQVKRATQSYVRDRTNHGTGVITSYAIAAGVFAAAGIFVIAAVFIGLLALYRWVGIKYGMFWGFGAVGGLLFLIAIVCAVLAASLLKRKPPHFPTLTSRLHVAITANPLEMGPVDVLRDQVAAMIPGSATAKLSGSSRNPMLGKNRPAQAGLIAAASLLSWMLIRRKIR